MLFGAIFRCLDPALTIAASLSFKSPFVSIKVLITCYSAYLTYIITSGIIFYVFEPPFCNTTSYKCSFFPNVIDSWNLLDVDMQNQHSRLMFKKQIRSNISVPPPYFALGTRKYNIFHCQLRNVASNLNQHKFLSHLSDGSGCPCGDHVEDNFHYFYVCPIFICKRILLFTQLRDLADLLSIDVLLKGSPDLSFDDNVLIMNSVHTFICGTKRPDY